MRFFLSGIIAVIFLNILWVLPVQAQSYGLGFYSHEVVQDKRTSLELSLNKVASKADLEVSFDLSFIPNRQIYFGYLLRLVTADKQNIDLIYDNQTNTKHFKIIIGEKLSGISFNIDEKALFNNWNRLRLVVDFKQDKLTLLVGREAYSESGIHLNRSSNYKLLFGANAYPQFQTTDLPPFKLRDVKVLQSDKLLAYWPLSEYQGDIAHETVSQNNGKVNNALWIKSRHRNWQMEKELTVAGDASLAFDPVTETVYMITADSLFSYSESSITTLKSAGYHTGRQQLIPGDQTLFNNNKLYYLYIDQKLVATYNIADKQWDKRLKKKPIETNNGHLNKFFCQLDSSIYTIGGYGQLVYKDSVKQYQLTTGMWRNIKIKGDVFTPRYMAGLGTNAAGDTVYVIGGYGSASGQQIVNPRNLYDMMRFDVKTKTFKKLFSINVKNEDFVFANSLVINEKTHTYYGLIFPQHKFNSNLQLIEGSLDKSVYKLVGDTIPYLFQDVKAYADIYYCPRSKKFLTVTLFKQNEQTRIKIYSLLSPPEPLVIPVSGYRSISYIWWISGVLIACLGVIVRRKINNRKGKKGSNQILPPSSAAEAFSDVSQGKEPPVETDHDHKVNCNKNAIFLFGDLQFFTANGQEITKYFTPLLKELFLVILLYSIKLGRGVSSEKLNEILWFDKSEKSARNNRSVNIAKLKSLLDKMGNCHLSKDTGYWKIEIDYSKIMVDYHTYINIVSNKNKLDKQKVIQLTHITQRGNFLSNIEYEWLDSFKSEVSNEIIDSYIQVASTVTVADDPEFLIKLANDIFYFDPVNEDAMIIKCKTLSYLGKHSLAKNTFESFSKEYRVIYGEGFERDFHSILE